MIYYIIFTSKFKNSIQLCRHQSAMDIDQPECTQSWDTFKFLLYIRKLYVLNSCSNITQYYVSDVW